MMKTPSRPRSHRPRLFACAAGALAIAAALVPTAAGAQTGLGAGVVVASEGLVAGGSGYSAKHYERPSDVPWTDFEATFAIPRGTSTGASLIPGVDFSQPWAYFHAFEITQAGLTPGGAENHCFSLANPTSWSEGYTSPEAFTSGTAAKAGYLPLDGVYFDVRCADGAGYDFYRVRFDSVRYEEPEKPWLDGRPWQLFWNGDLSLYGGAAGGHTWGYAENEHHGVVKLADAKVVESVDLSVYGRDSEGFHLVAGGLPGERVGMSIGTMHPTGTGLYTIAR